METDGEGMEETDGEGWRRLMERGWRRLMEGCWTSSPFVVALSWRVNIVAHCYCLVVASPGRVVVVPCCRPCAMSLSRSVSQRGGLGGRWDGGYLPSINNDERWMSFAVLVATSLSAMWHLHSPLAAGSCFHPWVAVSTYGWSFAFIPGRLCSWLSFSYICVHGRSFTFVAGHLCS